MKAGVWGYSTGVDRTLTLLASAFALATGHPVLLAAEEPVDFAREILPVLSDKCFCLPRAGHEEKDLVRLDSFEGATRDLEGYKAINPEAPAESEIIARINDADDPMPPEDAEKQLTADERKLIERWIKQGANTPSTGRSFPLSRRRRARGIRLTPLLSNSSRRGWFCTGRRSIHLGASARAGADRPATGAGVVGFLPER